MIFSRSDFVKRSGIAGVIVAALVEPAADLAARVLEAVLAKAASA
jgi:hypothetical protein